MLLVKVNKITFITDFSGLTIFSMHISGRGKGQGAGESKLKDEKKLLGSTQKPKWKQPGLWPQTAHAGLAGRKDSFQPANVTDFCWAPPQHIWQSRDQVLCIWPSKGYGVSSQHLADHNLSCSRGLLPQGIHRAETATTSLTLTRWTAGVVE